MSDAIGAVFFDLDDTLVHDGGGAAVQQTAVGLARWLPFTAEQILEANADAWSGCWADYGDRWMRGELSDDELPREIWRRTLDALGHDDQSLVGEAVAIHLGAQPGTLRLFDEARGVLEALRDAGVLIGVITNGPSEIQRAKMVTVGIDALFDVVVASGDIGVLKPDAEIFRRALAGLGVDAARSVHVGDNFMADVIGSADAGMAAVWINRSGAAAPEPDVPHHEAASLTMVLELAAPSAAVPGG